MGILNRASDGLVSVLIALRRALIAHGPLQEDRLLAICAPPAVVDQNELMARRTLVRWDQLGLFRTAGDRVHLADDFKRIAAGDLDSLRGALLRLVMSPDNNPGLGSEIKPPEDDSRAADFTRASAWILAQDPYTFPPSWEGVDELQNRQAADPRLFTNSTRWNGLVDWGVFLGIACPSPSGTGAVPNPAFAVRAVLDDVFGGVTESPQETFFSRLGNALPVVDGGVYREAVALSVPRVPRQMRDNEVSASLSIALLQLEASDEIRLQTKADAPYRLLLGRRGRELRRVTHITRVGRS